MKTFACYIILWLGLAGSVLGQTDSNLVWPQPPDQPRIRFVESISGELPFKSEPGFFSKVFGFLFGEKRESQGLVQPVGIAVGPGGELYVADPGAHGVHVIDRAKKEYHFISETKEGKLDSPVGVAVSSDGVIYVSDSGRDEILVFSHDRDLDFIIRGTAARPTGIAIIQNRLYVTDTDRHKVVVLDLKGNLVMEFGGRGTGTGSFNFPVAVAPRGNSVLVDDALNYRVESFDLSGKFLSTFGKQGSAAGFFASPKSVAADADGNIYVTDALMDNFQIFDSTGQLLLVIGGNGDRPGRFMSPAGIAFDAMHHFYVVDMLNHRIQEFEYLK